MRDTIQTNYVICPKTCVFLSQAWTESKDRAWCTSMDELSYTASYEHQSLSANLLLMTGCFNLIN